MKKTIFFASLTLIMTGLAVAACGRSAETAVEAPEGAVEGEELSVSAPEKLSDLLPDKAERDSVSYLVGVNFGSFLKGYNFGDDLNYRQILRGMKDFMAAKGDMNSPEFIAQLKHNPMNINNAFNSYLGKRSRYTAAVNKQAAEKFFAANGAKEGVETTESGLQYKIIEKGNDVVPGPRDTVWVRYKGSLLDGTVFDQSPEGVDSIRMMLSQVIKGWQEGLQLVGEGGKIELYIPAELGYGERGTRNIEANSALIFDIDLTRVGKVPAPVVKEDQE